MTKTKNNNIGTIIIIFSFIILIGILIYFLTMPKKKSISKFTNHINTEEYNESLLHKNNLAKYDRTIDKHVFVIFMKNSGWCWFQNPRAVLNNNKVIIGGVEGNGKGAAVIGIYDLNQRKIIGRTIVNSKFDKDDHNSPVFWIRPDGKLLTLYARHGRDNFHYYRISRSDDFVKWGSENVLKHKFTNKRDTVTYMNLYNMKNEGKLYNFFRGFNYNPTYVTSIDKGKTWSELTHFIVNEVDGRQRPYVCYTGNGKDTIHFSFTDAHPREFGNSIYYAAFRNGNFFKADGTIIKNLKINGPLLPSEADKLFHGGDSKCRSGHIRVPNSAWTSSIVIDKQDQPHIGYTLYKSNTDHRYRMVFWNGKKWIDREVAYGGTCLYDNESSYTGLITLDPVDPTYVIISTNVDPTTNKYNNGKYEIYSGKVNPNDNILTIKWQPITYNSPVHNIRPVILNKDGKRVVLWQRGDYKTFVNYDLDTVGIIETF